MRHLIPDFVSVLNKNSKVIGYIDRTFEMDTEPEIYVQLPCGFKVTFWMRGLTNEEYIKRAELIKKNEME